MSPLHASRLYATSLRATESIIYAYRTVLFPCLRYTRCCNYRSPEGVPDTVIAERSISCSRGLQILLHEANARRARHRRHGEARGP